MEAFEIISVFCDVDKGLLGNTAAVVLLREGISDERMQALASDMNQPATTYLWPAGAANTYYVRWFAPDGEIGLCGHGTLAAMAFLKQQNVELHYREGVISGAYLGESSAMMQLSSIPLIKTLEVPAALTEGLGIPVEGYYSTSNKNIVVVKDEEMLRQMKPDFARLRRMDTFGYAVTTTGREVDFVSRTLVPHVQQLEDHATGSSHAALAPFWSKRLKKNDLTALQLSPRGGSFKCKIQDSHVLLTGNFRKVARGQVDG